MAGRVAWCKFLISALITVCAGSGVMAQGAVNSFNPAAAASDIRNPSSINPAARASDIRDSTSINPAAAASDRRRFGVAVPDSPSAVNRQPALSRTVARPGRRVRQVRRPRPRGEAVRAASKKGDPAQIMERPPRNAAPRKAERAAAGIMGSVCRGC